MLRKNTTPWPPFLRGNKKRDDKMTIAWYHTFFDEDYLKFWGFFTTPDRTQREVDFILQVLALPQGSRLLDLCCGQGRHALEVARRGYQVVGLDLSETLLRHARKQAKEQNLSMEFVHSDMRRIPFEDEFNAVVNLFTAFGYLEEDEEDEKVIQAVAKALKAGGKFLIDLQNHERLMRDFSRSHFTELPDGSLCLEEGDFDILTGRIKTRWLLVNEKGERKERTSTLRIYTFTELHRMLKSAELQVKQVFGGFDDSDYKMDSKRMIVLAEKL
ncbi:methyltransferase domain-containing protein [Candidatus Poribacteria bacterium]|nr:methyltransferase domain-containing protein [Candidatus Poribacteria bacterium]